MLTFNIENRVDYLDSVFCVLIGRYEGLNSPGESCMLRVNPQQVAQFPVAMDGPFQLLSTAPTLQVLYAEIKAVGDNPESTVENLVDLRLAARVGAFKDPLIFKKFKKDLMRILLSHLYPNIEFVGTSNEMTPLVRAVKTNPGDDRKTLPFPVSLPTLEVLTAMGLEPIGPILEEATKKLGLSDEVGIQMFADDLPVLLRKGAAYLGYP